MGWEPGTIVSREGITYEPDTVEVDLSVPDRPLWRFRANRGTSSKKEKGLIPVRRTFLGFFEFLEGAPMLAKEWEASPFTPSGAHASRAISVGLDDETVTGTFLTRMQGWFTEMAKKGKPV